MKIQDVMTHDVRCIDPEATVAEAAALMRKLDVGALPVCDHDRLAGIVTDRDISIRVVAEGLDPQQTTVQAAMSPHLVFVYEDQTVDEAAHAMEQHQIRRLPVLSRQKRLVGIVSLGDLAVQASAGLSGETLKEVSQPSHSGAAS